MVQRIGILILFFGSTLADSENLLIPATVLAVGAALILIGKRLEA